MERVIDLLPLATAAAVGHRTGRHDPVGRGFDEVMHLGKGVVFFQVQESRLDPVAGDGIAHKDYPTVIESGDRVATGGQGCDIDGNQLALDDRFGHYWTPHHFR